jgi:uncharacterized membrane protein
MITNINDFILNIIEFGGNGNNIVVFLVYVIIWLGIYKFIKAVNDYV